jgi:hypothetical protein
LEFSPARSGFEGDPVRREIVRCYHESGSLVRLLAALAAFLTGCGAPKPPPAPPPGQPGTSLPIAYPLLVLETLAPRWSTFDDEETFTTTSVSSGRGFVDQQFIDSAGGFYACTRVSPIGKVRSVWLDMGTSRYRVFVDLKLVKRIKLDDAKKLVLDIVRSPRADWAGSPELLNRTVARVDAYQTVPELVADCAKSWDWR